MTITERLNIKDRTVVTFTLPSGDIEVSIRDGKLSVSAYAGQLKILPIAGNAVSICHNTGEFDVKFPPFNGVSVTPDLGGVPAIADGSDGGEVP
jgi:hypothetical protein